MMFLLCSYVNTVRQKRKIVSTSESLFPDWKQRHSLFLWLHLKHTHLSFPYLLVIDYKTNRYKTSSRGVKSVCTWLNNALDPKRSLMHIIFAMLLMTLELGISKPLAMSPHGNLHSLFRGVFIPVLSKCRTQNGTRLLLLCSTASFPVSQLIISRSKLQFLKKKIERRLYYI